MCFVTGTHIKLKPAEKVNVVDVCLYFCTCFVNVLPVLFFVIKEKKEEWRCNCDRRY